MKIAIKGIILLFMAMPVLGEAQDLIWYNDVSNCADWEFGNGSDEIGFPWYQIDLNFECSTEGPAGAFNQWAGGTGNGQAADPINSTTADNGFLLIDSDLFGIDAQYDASWVENSWVQTAYPIDCSDYPFVALSFETRYRCWDNGSSDGSEKCFVEISRDGLTWPTLSNDYVTSWEEDGLVIYGEDTVQCRYEVFPDSETGFETDDPSFVEIDMSEAAGGKDMVWVRFRWVGTWGYSWEIDDIFVVNIPENDIRIDGYQSYTNYLQTGVYENGAWAQSQMLPTLSAGAKAYNFGYGTQTGVTMDVEVNGMLYNSGTIASFPNAAADTLSAEYEVLDIGTYTVNYQLGADDMDENPGNNVASQSFEVTEHSYGRDNGELVDVYGGAFDFVCMPYYQIHEDATIYGMDVAIMDGAVAGSPTRAFIVNMYEVVPLDGYLNGFEIAQSSEVELNPGYTWSGDGDIVWYTFEFEDPYQASAGDWIGAAFEYYGGDALTIGESSTTFAGTAAIYGPAGVDNIYAWRGTDEMPMVRLNLDPNLVPTPPLVTGCTDASACNYDMEAFSDDGSCIYIGQSCNDGNYFTYNDQISSTCECIGYACTDVNACNYIEVALTDTLYCDYSCLGCTDIEAINFNYYSTIDDGSCIYFQTNCNYLGSSEWNGFEPGVYVEAGLYLQFGQNAEEFAVLHIPEEVEEPSSGSMFTILEWTNLQVSGMPDGLDLDNLPASAVGNSQACLNISGVPMASGVFEVEVSGELIVSFFGNPYSIGIYSSIFTLTVGSNPGIVFGCTYPHALNFNPVANSDDGSCEFAGCTDVNASNYEPYASVDDGTCDTGPCITSCLGDLNYDGSIGSLDLLELLTAFGGTCD